eukprot:TRINITY_DN2975_c0_g1_i2.p1 TRINITY_DN2975_c0_g1~~TRINITY_DN2975_c0_g1_i2.p1  ORF type:complete len:227 (+),score=54.71 TRINITY_DN2975_c0_g1_i2:202-882(+)
MADVEEKQQKSSKTVSTDPNDHTIIKEGDADILIHANNEVFCNRTQVNNRDASIAFPRTFISKRKEEHAGLLSKKVKVEHQASEGSSRAVPEQAISAHDEKPNGECEVQMGPTEDEPIGISKEPLKTLGGKVCRELKPPRVLEALAASGLRALRYACEVEEIGQVIPVDNDKVAHIDLQFGPFPNPSCCAAAAITQSCWTWSHRCLVLNYFSSSPSWFWFMWVGDM